MIFYKSVLPLLILLFIPIFPQNADYSINKRIEVEIDDQEDGKYKFTYAEENIVTKLKDKKSDFNNFFVYENFYNETNDLKMRSKSIVTYKRDIPYFIPDRADIFITSGKVYFFTAPASLKKGDEFTYEFEQEFDDVAYLPVIWLGNNYDYENVKVTLYHPDDIKPIFDVYGVFQEYPFEVKYIDTDETVFEISNVKAADEFNYFPSNDYLLFILINLQSNGHSLNNVTPKEFVQWYSTLTSLEPELDLENKQFLSAEVSACHTKWDKLKVINDYVKNNFRYIADEQGSHSIIPRMPSIVLGRGYADCKERASLVSAIAREHNIDVNMVLVTKETAIDNDFIYVNKFNHVICSSTINNETVFFDPTAKYCEFGNLPESEIGRDALILDFTNPSFTKINAPKQEHSLIIKIFASIDSVSRARAEITLQNDYFSVGKHAVDDLTGVQLENFLSMIVLNNLYKISLDYFSIKSESDSSLEFNATADLSEFVISSNTKKYLPKIPFLLLEREVLERLDDSLSLYLENRVSIDLDIILDSGSYLYECDSLYLSDQQGITQYKATMSETQSGKLLFSYSLLGKEKVFDNVQKKEFINFYNRYLLNKSNMFILTSE